MTNGHVSRGHGTWAQSVPVKPSPDHLLTILWLLGVRDGPGAILLARTTLLEN